MSGDAFAVLVCAATTCAATRGDTVVYLDDNHLTDAFVRGLTPTIDSALGSVLVGKVRAD